MLDFAARGRAADLGRPLPDCTQIPQAGPVRHPTPRGNNQPRTAPDLYDRRVCLCVEKTRHIGRAVLRAVYLMIGKGERKAKPGLAQEFLWRVTDGEGGVRKSINLCDVING